MAAPPSGTLTMLFSDIEGSTLLLQRLGPDYRDALATQRKVLRAVWRARGGREMGTEGDSFFVVFPMAHDAVAATLDAQQGLRTTDWPAGARVRVRMGLHTGEPTPYEDGYVGMDVHRAARVAAIAHGGQVVLTDTTAALVRGSLPEGARLSDLGEHRLKDLSTPEHLFQLWGPGDDEVFPPVRSLGTTSSLPQPRTTLVGRDTDRARLMAMLSEPDIRLVTLLGPGGTGKTRLAVDVANHLADAHPDGVYFVPLAAVTTSDALWATLADRLDLTDDRTAEHVLERVAHQRLLLVLDNLEQLPAASDAVAALLAGAPRLRILATSRRPLHVGGEHEYAVSPLEVPVGGGLDDVRRSAAVRLFCERAASVRHEFELDHRNAESVATICRRLDGLPLAIELAAARCKLFSPAALLARLDGGLDATSAEVDRPTRQRSLRDTVSWSHDLLDPELQEFFRRLGAFPGTADLSAVEAVTGRGADSLDAVAALVDLSLVRMTEGPDGEPRVHLLQTIRDYARELLVAAGESDDVQRRHATHYADAGGGARPPAAYAARHRGRRPAVPRARQHPRGPRVVAQGRRVGAGRCRAPRSGSPHLRGSLVVLGQPGSGRLGQTLVRPGGGGRRRRGQRSHGPDPAGPGHLGRVGRRRLGPGHPPGAAGLVRDGSPMVRPRDDGGGREHVGPVAPPQR